MQNFHSQLTKIINDLTENGYAICEHFLPGLIIQALAAKAEKRYTNGDMRTAKTGKNAHSQQITFRSDSI